VAEREFTLAYRGPALDDGRMEVRDLAPALLALGDLLQDAARLVAPDSPDVALEIRAAPERGSFLVHLAATQPDLGDQIVNLLTSQEAQAAAVLAALMSAVVGGTKSVLWLIKRLGGRTVLRQEGPLVSGEVRLILDDATIVETPGTTFRLYRSVEIRQEAQQVVAPLARDGVEALEVRIPDEEPLQIDGDDLDAFFVPEVSEIEVTDVVTEMVLRITSVSFTENKWRFNDGDHSFAADMDDEQYRERIAKGDESFRYGDSLRCRVRFRQWQSEDGRLRVNHSVVEVLEHIPRPVELSFDL
jgi:hypothetical protein